MRLNLKYGLLCLLLLIGFNLFVLYGGYLHTPLGKLSTIISYVAIFPFIIFSILEKRKKEFPQGIPMRDAVKTAMFTVIVIAVGYAIFTYIFYSVKMTDYIVNYYEQHPPIPAKGIQPIKKSDIQEVFSPFNRTRAAFLGTMMTGLCLSFVISVFLSRKESDV
jgi:hypothetical protein